MPITIQPFEQSVSVDRGPGTIQQFYPFDSIDRPSYRKVGSDYILFIEFSKEGNVPLEFKILDISNQPTWTNNEIGAETALQDIIEWMSAAASNSSVDTGLEDELEAINDNLSGQFASAISKLDEANTRALNIQDSAQNIGENTDEIESKLSDIYSELQNKANLTDVQPVAVQNFPATQNVAIVSSVEFEVKNDSGNPIPVSGNVTITDGSGPVTIDGTVSVSNFPSVQSVSQSGTWNLNNISGTITLPSGAATSANQTITNNTLTSIDAGIPSALGQTTMSASMPVVLPSNQSAIPVTQSGVWSYRTQDGSGNAITSSLIGSKQRLDVNSASSFAEDSLHISGDFGNFVLGVRNDAATTVSTNSNGDYSPISTNDRGEVLMKNIPYASQVNSPLSFQNLGAAATQNVKSTAGNVFSITCYNASNQVRYIQIHNTATVPAAAAVPSESFMVPSNGQIVIGTDYFTNNGVYYSAGIAFAFSETRNTYTAANAADQTTRIKYI